MNKFNLNERPCDSPVEIKSIADSLPNTKVESHIEGQSVRPETSPKLNYGEALPGESGRDCIHQLQTASKELHKSMRAIKIVKGGKSSGANQLLNEAEKANDELISISVESITSARRVTHVKLKQNINRLLQSKMVGR